MDLSKIFALIGTIKSNLSGLRDTLSLQKGPARSAEGQAALAKYGPIRTEAARLSANVREAGPAQFAGSATGPQAMRERQGRIESLSDAKAMADEFGQQVGAMLVAEKETQSLEIDETLRVVKALYDNPLCDAALKERLSPFASELLELVASKNADQATRRLDKIALKQEVTTAQSSNEHLKLRNKYLEGERLSPDELAAPAAAAPAAAKGRRRRMPR